MGLTDTVKAWFGSTKQETSESAERAAPHVDSAKERVADHTHKTEDFAHDATDSVSSRVGEPRSHVAPSVMSVEAATGEGSPDQEEE
jgi:hypothetical protein